jgi:hypothetical protein
MVVMEALGSMVVMEGLPVLPALLACYSTLLTRDSIVL